jgi:hypothetical protein
LRPGDRLVEPPGEQENNAMVSILWAILVVVLILWLVGLLAGVAGSAIHLLLIVALAVLIYNLLTGRRAV